MAGVNKIILGSEDGDRVLVDLTGDSVTPDSLVTGHTAHGADGEIVEGANPYVLEATNAEVSAQTGLIAQIAEALEGKAAGGGKPEQEKSVEIAENGEHIITPDDGYTLSKVTVNVASSGEDTAGALADRTITEFSSDTCTKIGVYAFRDCKNLKTIVAPNATTVGEYALYGCSSLKSIVLPSVTTIAQNSFREASNLEVIDFPKLTAIPGTAFYGCRGLKTLILRSETMVTLSATSAFTQCYRILGTKNSGYNPNGEKLGFFYVPRILLEQYVQATNWSDESLVTQFRAIEDYPDICGTGG